MGERALESYWLSCHPETPAIRVDAIQVQLERIGNDLWLRYFVECDPDRLALPNPTAPNRTDDLWKHTCFEAFVGKSAYSEFNFSPSSEWSAYEFDAYRKGMRNRAVDCDPRIGIDASDSHFALEATFDVEGLDGSLAISAVIEERDGTKSYWALAHPPGAPDFHHPTCFAATLPAPEMP